MFRKKAIILQAVILTILTLSAFTGCSFKGSLDNSGEQGAASSNASDSDDLQDEDDKSSDDPGDETEEGTPSALIEKHDATYKELAEKLVYEKEINPDDIRRHRYGDFDQDRIHECFFFIGDPIQTDVGTAFGNVFFVNSAGCNMLCDTRFIGVEPDGEVFRALYYDNAAYVIYNEIYATDNISYVYRIIGSEIVESSISGIGKLQISDKDPKQIIITLSAYDLTYTREPGLEGAEFWTGHTWKDYYFYYDEKEGYFKEYGGTRIDEEELKKICGFDLGGEIKREGYEIGDIFKRENGIVNVNYSKKEKDEFGKTTIQYMNANYDQKKGEFINVWDSDETNWKSSNYGGIYQAALLPEIATYE